MDNNEKAILRALIYSNIFSYPLTKDELWRYAVSETQLDKKQFFITLKNKSNSVRSLFTVIQGDKQLVYFLKDKKTSVGIRLEREKIAQRKLLIAQKISKRLSRIPFIECICLSGSLSMNNTQESDDIDFFIITKPHTLWLSRLLILLYLAFVGKRRKRYGKHIRDTICVNLLIETTDLSFSETHNLYTAHEIAQAKPLFDRNYTYKFFLNANLWVRKFLPNAVDYPSLQGSGQKELSCLISESTTKQSREDFTELPGFTRNEINKFILFLNFLAKYFQLWYMKKEYDSEIIADTKVAFYPIRTSNRILEKYKEGLELYEI